METNKFSKKAIGSVLIGGLLLSLGGIAMAGTTEDATNSASKTSKSGIFSKFVGNKGMRGMQRGNMDPAAMQANLKTKLATLVSAGNITQAKADAVVAALTKNQEARKAEMEKIKALTPEERKTYMQNNKADRKDPIAQLVVDGVVTQADADAIAKLMPQRGPGQGRKVGRGMGGNFDPAQMQAEQKANLAKLVNAGTITQAQADKIIAKCTQEQTTKAAEFAKIKAMTETQRQEYFKANQDKEKRVNPISQLVNDGTITQAQADAIAKTMPNRGIHQGGKGAK